MPRNKGSLNKHKKEKPHKEKKQKKPRGGIKQKQHQHQIVNVTVNNGDGGNVKKKASPIPQIPLNIFDPSLITPHYSINNRQPVNPPDPENVDMTELLTRLTAQFQPTQPLASANKETPITNIPPVINKDKPITITQPPVKIKEPPIKIKADDIKPPEIEGEIIGETPIQTKHKNNRIKQIAEQILPKGQKLSKTKYKDTEGLGMKIPTERIGQIAGTIASGALTGGLTLAGEALVTGGLSTLTGDAIAGSMIGGGVGSSVNEALGGGQIANVLSGIAGGVAARKAISKYRQRQQRQNQSVEETQPLLGGQRVGGSRNGRSRLVTRDGTNGSEITRIGNDDIEFVPQQPQQSTISKIKEITSRKAKEATQQMLNIGNQISDGAQQIRQRISGRSKNDGRGAYERVQARNDDIELKDMRPEASEAASVIQGYLKKRPATQAKIMIEREEDLLNQTKHAGKPLWKKTIDEARDINKKEKYMDKLQEKQEKMYEQKQQRDQLFALTDRANYGDDPLDIEHFLRNNRKGNAANTIQSAIRNKTAKIKMEKAKVDKVNGDAAAKLQAAIKRKNSDKVIKDKSFEKLIEDEAQKSAANTIKAAVKREDVQRVYNVGVENQRAANKITAAIKRKNSDKVIKNLKETSMKTAIKNMKTPYVIPKFKNELETKAVTPLEQAALGDNSTLKTLQTASAASKLENALKRSIAQGKLRSSENAAKRLQASARRNEASSNYHELDKRSVVPITDVEAELAKIGIRKKAKTKIIETHELDKRGLVPNLDNSVKTLQAAARKRVTQNEYKDIKAEKNAVDTIQASMKRKKPQQDFQMKNQQLKLEEELKQMEANKGKQIKALDTIKGALNQKVARKKVNDMKMDKLGNILHFKKEAAKSTFRGLLKTNDKRLGVRGFTVKVPLSEKAKVRESVKKEVKQLADQYKDVMKGAKKK